MNEILRTRQLLDGGYGQDELRRLERAGRLRHVRRGAWVRPNEPTEQLTVEARHRLLLRAVALQVLPGAVISHGSAAILHGLPGWPAALQRVHLTRSRSSGAKRRSDVEVHGATLPAAHITMVDGLAVTTLARTVADLGRTLPFAQAVAAGDRAAALGLDFGHLEDVLRTMEQWPGVRQARRVADFIDGRSQSVGESVSRVVLGEQGLPAPTLQHEIRDPTGRLVACTDFAWVHRRTVGEFDGRIKYGALLKPGQRPEDVVFAEKLREDAVRDLRWQVVRWTWRDVERPRLLRDRVLRAFDRAG